MQIGDCQKRWRGQNHALYFAGRDKDFGAARRNIANHNWGNRKIDLCLSPFGTAGLSPSSWFGRLFEGNFLNLGHRQPVP